MIDINVGSTMSLSKFLNHLNFSFKFSSNNLWSWTVYEYFGSVQSSVNHGVIWDPGLLTNFVSNRSVFIIYDEDSNWYCDLACEFLNNLRELKLSNLSFVFPGWKASSLIVHVAISGNGFDSNSNHFGLIKNDSGVVESCFV